MLIQNNGIIQPQTIDVFYTGTDNLSEGMALCYDYSQSTVLDRSRFAVKPSYLNLISNPGFIGLVAEPFTYNASLAKSINSVAGQFVRVIPFHQGHPLRPIKVFTDVNVAQGDLLGPRPGSYTLGKSVCVAPVARAMEAVDRSATSGTVNVEYGRFGWDADATKLHRWVDHFRGGVSAGTLATQLPSQDYLLKGTATFTEQATEDVPVGLGRGELTLRAAATTIVSIQQPGAQWLLTTGRELFCRQIVKIDDISDEDFCVGLFTAGTNNGSGVVTPADLMTAANPPVFPADYINFAVDASASAGLLNFQSQVTSAGSTVSTGVALVNDTYAELAFLVRNRVTGAAANAKTLYVFVNGALTNSLETAAWAADVPTVLGLAWGQGVINGTPTSTIDYLEINCHL